jgi:hypothetical protein
VAQNDSTGLTGTVAWELRDENGELKSSGKTHNLITDTGDTVYAQRGAGVGSPAAVPTGMKLGTGGTAVAKNGAGAALVTYLSNSHQAFDATYPSSASVAGAGNTITYKVTYAAGKATSAATAITEVVIVNDALADSTSTAANTVSRALLTGIGSKQSTDTLTVTWTHKLLGA